MRTETQLRWILDKQLAWIAAADSKLTVLVPLASAMLAASFVVLEKSLPKWQLLDVPAGVAIILLSLSLYFSFSVIISRTDGPVRSSVFFGPISRMDQGSYSEMMENLSDESFAHDLTEQIHRNAVISNIKHNSVRRSSISLAAALPFWLVSILLA